MFTNQAGLVQKGSTELIRTRSELYKLLEKFKLSPYQSFDFLAAQGQTSSVVYLQPDDVLFAQSDAMQNVFSVVVSYRELNELTA